MFDYLIANPVLVASLIGLSGVLLGLFLNPIYNLFSHRFISAREKASEWRRGRFDLYKDLSDKLIGVITNYSKDLTNENNVIKSFNEMQIYASSNTINAVHQFIDQIVKHSKEINIASYFISCAVQEAEMHTPYETIAEKVISNIKQLMFDRCLQRFEDSKSQDIVAGALNQIDSTGNFITKISIEYVRLSFGDQNFTKWLPVVRQDLNSFILDLQREGDSGDSEYLIVITFLSTLVEGCVNEIDYQINTVSLLRNAFLEMRADLGLQGKDISNQYELRFMRLAPTPKDFFIKEVSGLIQELRQKKHDQNFLREISASPSTSVWRNRAEGLRDSVWGDISIPIALRNMPDLLIEMSQYLVISQGLDTPTIKQILEKIDDAFKA